MGKPQYAPLPMRATADRDLDRLDLHILAIICGFDRLSGARKSGAGCYISNQKIAAIAGCHYSNVAKSMNKLEQRGYTARERHPDNGRIKTVRVIYIDADKAVYSIQPEKTVGPQTNDNGENVGEESNPNTENVGMGQSNSRIIPETYPEQYIPRRVEIDLLKVGNRFCETAQFEIARLREQLEFDVNDQQVICQTERLFKGYQKNLIFERSAYEEIIEICEQVSEEATDIQSGNQANRLADDVSYYLENISEPVDDRISLVDSAELRRDVLNFKSSQNISQAKIATATGMAGSRLSTFLNKPRSTLNEVQAVQLRSFISITESNERNYNAN